MARINRREWYSTGTNGRRVKRGSYGFTVMVDGRRVKRFNADWQRREDAERGLAAYLLGVEQTARPTTPRGMTLEEAVERLLLEKSRHRTIDDMRRVYLAELLPAFGKDTPLVDISVSKIAAYRAQRMAATSRSKDAAGAPRALSAAAVNRPLAFLRHLLRTAQREWETLPAVPRVTLLREPEGKLGWLSAAAETALLAACRRSRNPHLHALVLLAIETGMRRGELLALDWSRIDLTRGVLVLAARGTKSKRRREIPMRQAVYDLLAQWPTREGALFPSRNWNTYRHAFEFAAATVTTAPEGEPLTFHGLRHHFASWFMMRGGRLETLSKILGHATLAMTMRYSHLSPDFMRSEMQKTERVQPHASEVPHVKNFLDSSPTVR